MSLYEFQVSFRLMSQTVLCSCSNPLQN